MAKRAVRARAAAFRVAIVGAGKVGTVLGKVLAENGARIECVISRSAASARKAARFLGCRKASTSVEAIPSTVNLIYLTVPHAAVPDVARTVASSTHLLFRGLAVCHASGMLTAEVLEPLRARGAVVFSFHPLQTFPRDFHPREIVPTARGIAYGADGAPASWPSADVASSRISSAWSATRRAGMSTPRGA